MSYFSGINNIEDLNSKYNELIRENNPLLNDDSDYSYTCICTDINDEYEVLSKRFSEKSSTYNDISFRFRGNRVLEDIKRFEKRREFSSKIVEDLSKLPVYRRYFKCNSLESYPNDDVIVSEDNTLNGGSILADNKFLMEDLYSMCLNSLNLSHEEIIKLYELCGSDAEKFKRVVLFLCTGALYGWDIHYNLQSDNPIPFFDDDIEVDGMPDYDSAFLLISEVSSHELYRAWINFCTLQRASFENRAVTKLYRKGKVAVKR